MGSVPRINCLIVTFSLLYYNNLYSRISLVFRIKIYDKQNKGVSIVSYQLPYTLITDLSYTITKNSKAA